MPKQRLIFLLLAIAVALSLVSCDETPMPYPEFSCDETRLLDAWRARVYESLSAGVDIADAHDPNAKDPAITLRRLRDVQLQLGHYFQTEPMPECMRKAIRIYVDGTQALQRNGGSLPVAMKQMDVAANGFYEAVQIAKPEWAREGTPAPD